MFELKERDGLGRICELSTAHGKVETPALMPVINPNQLTIAPREMARRFGTRMLITNSYIIMSDERLRGAALEKGVHSILDFEGVVMTDSGTFQDHVYGDLDIDPDAILDFQKGMGTDIGTMLDVFIEPGDGHDDAERKMGVTLDRARSAAGRKGGMMLAGVVQGGTFPELRTRCASGLSGLDLDVYAIGGVVPLMESYRFEELAEVVIASKKGLKPDRPVHLFGCGHPMLFALAVLLGCDLFDSSSYAKFAKDGRLMFPSGTRRREDLTESPCECPVCTSTSLGEMSMEDIALHNLYVSFAEIKRVKQAVREGSLWELAESRARAHPYLLSALRGLARHKEYLERFEGLSRRGALFYTGPETLARPALFRYRERLLSRFERPARVLVEAAECGKPYSRYLVSALEKLRDYDAHLVVRSVMGPVPVELDGMYPLAQSLAPSRQDLDAREYANAFFERFFEAMGYEKRLVGPSEADLKGYPRAEPFDLDLMRVRAVADMQFGRGAGRAMTAGKVELIKSRTTGRIRNVLLDGRHVLSMRAHDGLFTLKLEGGRMLHALFRRPGLRVVVNGDSAEFNLQGRNVFAKFVLGCDGEIRPGDEVLVVDEGDTLVAVGRALMNREEMLAFKTGVAVDVREGSGSTPGKEKEE